MSYNIEIVNNIKNDRKNGLSLKELNIKYSPIPEGTIYTWIKEIPIDKTFSIQKRIETIKNKTKQRRTSFMEEGKKIAQKNINNKLFIAGCALYWAEGSKNNQVFTFTNCDYQMHKLILDFLKKFFPILSNNKRFNIQMYESASVIDIENFWSQKLNEKIIISYKTIKKQPLEIKNNNGILSIVIANTELIHQIKGAIDELFSIDMILKSYKKYKKLALIHGIAP